MRAIKQLNLSSVSAVSLFFSTWCFCAAPLLAADDIGVVQGGLERQVYTNIFGFEVSDLTNSAKFPDHPDVTNTVTSFETPSQSGDMYGERLIGYLLPPVTGDYVFYLASDDQGALYLSTNMSPSGKVLIAFEATWSFPRSWTGSGGGRVDSANISAPIHLVADQRYYVEALHKESGGGDNFGVAWQLPGDPPPVNGSDPIPGANLGYGCHTNYPPRVTIITPGEGSAFLAGGNITLGANATVVSNPVKEVRFYEGSNFIGRTEIPTLTPLGGYLVTWSNVLAGNYTLTAQATDAVGLTGTSAPVHITVSYVERRPPILGSLLRQVYTNIPGNTVSALTNSPKFPDSPDLLTVVSSFEAPSNVGDNYGQRLSGYLLSPAITFSISLRMTNPCSFSVVSGRELPISKTARGVESSSEALKR